MERSNISNQSANLCSPRAENLSRLSTTQIDVTERKRAEQALRESEAKIRRLVDANIIGIIIWDFDGRIIEANDAFLRMVDYDREDLVSGRIRWTELTPAEWRERDEHAVAELRSTGTFQPFEKEYFRKDGSRMPVLIGGATVRRRRQRGRRFRARFDGAQMRRASIAGERGEVPRLRRDRLRLVLGNRSGLQIHAADRECIWFRLGRSNRHGVLGARSRP